MNFFDQIDAKKKKQGKYKACLTAKWVNLSRVKTPDNEIDLDDASEFLVKDKKTAKLIKKHFEDLTIEFNDEETDIVSNVSIDEWGSGGLSDDFRSIKWIEVTFYFDTKHMIKKDWSEIEDYLRFNFYCDLEVEKANGYIVFQFADWEDNSIKLLTS